MPRRRSRWLVALCLGGLLAGGGACRSSEREAERLRSDDPAARRAAAVVVARGRALVERFECHRCHDGTGLAAVATNKNCVQCHRDILADKFEAPPAARVRWKRRIVSLPDAPSLAGIGERLRREWIARYLLRPHDLRPGLRATMPRLALTPAQAREIAAYLVPGARTPRRIARLDLARGRRLFEQRGCRACHAFGGVFAGPIAGRGYAAPTARAQLLAPDLRHARERLRPDRVVEWLRAPQHIKPGTPMPNLQLSEDDAKQLASFIFHVPLAPARAPAVPQRLPVLARSVPFAEVSRLVFHDTCWHCHAEPDYARGDGGPGNTGGFGFERRGLDLSSYEGIASGDLDDRGERRSIFAATGRGPSRLVASLLARQAEIAGRPVDGIRGMPLGLPPLSPQQIQLVESWIAQGRRP